MNEQKDLRGGVVGRAHSTLSVSALDYYLHIPTSKTGSLAISTITLTPGRIRNIDRDMEALRASRQDNPFIQQVIASRESLIDSVEEESDHTNLMSKELSIDVEVDPVTLPEMHEHLIRSPPPTTWPSSPNYRIFQFPNSEEEMLHVEFSPDERIKPENKPQNSNWDGSESSLVSKSHNLHHDVFSLLTSNSLRSVEDDSVHLIAED